MSTLTPIERNTAKFHKPNPLQSHLIRGLKDLADCNVRVLAAVVGLLAVTNFAWGADLSPPLAPAPYSWTGLYLGLNAGYASATVANTVSGGGLDGSGSVAIPAGIGGAQIGYNYQIGPMVLGFEADFDGNMATKSSPTIATAGGTTSGTDQIPWIGTLRGRVGVAFEPFLALRNGRRRGDQVCFDRERRCHRLRRVRTSRMAHGRPAAASKLPLPMISACGWNTFTSTPAISMWLRSGRRSLRLPAECKIIWCGPA